MRLFGLLILLCLAELLRAQCSCTDCALDLPGGQTTESTIDISGSTNDVLGTNGQAIQAICINFLHDAINEANFTLIAPDGSSVQLVQSTGTSFDDNVFFNICFVACSQTAEPDPGFSEVFDSGENWMFAGIYSGSYYPAVGCLEDLTGSINGEWTLEVDDVEVGDGGELLDWCIQFADDAGLGCGTTCFEVDCEADGGEIPDASGTYCQNDPALDLDLTPIFPSGEPDPTLYSYNYAYVNPATNVIEQFSIATDLTFFFPGEYQLCGFSYLTSDFDLLPFPPPVDYTYQDLLDDIDAGTFCADLSDNCITITIDSVPEAPDWTGPTSVCPGELVIYEVLNYDPSEYTYLFSINQGSFSQFINNGGSLEVIWNSGPGELCVSVTNGCGTVDSCLQITVGSTDDDVEITGNTDVCVSDLETYTLSPALEPGQNYVVSVTNGTAFPVQGNTVQVNWDPGTTGQICVEIAGTGCVAGQGCLDVNINPFVPPLFVDNPMSLCIGQTGFASVPDDPEVLGYNWFGDGFTILSGQGSNIIEIQADAVGTAQTCVELTTSCGLDTVCTDLNIFNIPDPMITAAEPTPACGNDFNIFLVFSPGTDLLWSVIDGPPGGLTLTNEMSAVLNVSVNQTGTYSIQIEESIGDCIGYDTITIDITGGVGTTVSTDCDLDGNYTVNLELNGGTEPYTINGVPIVGNIFISDPIPSGDQYNFIIEDANGCLAQVGGNGICPCISSAGTMGNDPIEVCGATGEEVTAETPLDSVLDNNDAGVFVLHEGSGGNLINIVETNTTGTFGFQGGMVYGETYYISFVVGNALGGVVDLNDPCLSVASGQPVIFYDVPQIQYNGADQSCDPSATVTIDVSGDATSTNWSINGPGTVDVQSATTETVSFTVSLSGVYTIEAITTNGFCSDTLEFDFEILAPLNVQQADAVCDGSDLYILTLVISGGTAPFTANIPGSFNGDTFTSEFLPTSDATSIVFVDSEGCELEYTSGPVNCDCESEAGIMSSDTIAICEGETEAQITFLGGGQLDGDDTESFVLHAGSGTVIVDPIFVFTGNSFGIIPGLIPGQVYYISHVVGNDLGGLVDINDPCLDVSLGQPFIIQPEPNFEIPDFTEACSGPIDIPILNAGPGGQVALVNNSSGGPVDVQLNGGVITVSADIPTTVEVSYIESVGNCARGDTITVIFFSSPEVTNVSEECIGDEVLISFEITNGSPPYTVNGENVSGVLFVSDTIDSGQLAEFTITDGRGCEAFYSTTVDCQCITDAGTLSGTIPEACVGEDIDINSIVLNVGQLDPNDSIYLIVHDGTVTDIGNVIDTPQLGVVEYKPEFIPGQTYFLAAIAGNALNGGIDPNDPCFSSANGLPLIWNEGNTAALADTIFACAGDSVLIPVSGGGTFPFTVELSSDAGRDLALTLDGNSGSVGVEVLPGAEVWTISNIGGVCSSAEPGQVVINGESVQVPEFTITPDICNNPLFGSVLNLDDLITNGVGGTWISSDFTIANNRIDFDGVQEGIYVLSFIPNQVLCQPGFFSINIEVVDCDCPIVTVPNGIDLCETISGYDLNDRFNVIVGGVWSLRNPNNLPQPPVVSSGLLDLTGSSPGSYTLLFTITDSIAPQCEDQFSLNLNVVALPVSGVQSFVPVLCQGVDQELDLNSVLSNAEPGGTWTYGGVAVSNVISSTALVFGANTFVYTVENTLCGEVSVDVIVELGEPPEAGQQAELQLWCENSGARVDLDSLLDGSAPGGVWTYEGQELDSVVSINDLSQGRNVLVYEVGLAPCSDTAQVIFYINPQPQYLLSAMNVSCFGERDGFVAVEVRDIGTGPYIVTIDGFERTQITDVGPDTYFVIIEDAIGCQNTELVTISEPPLLELELTAPDTIFEGEEATVRASTNAPSIAVEDWEYDGSLVTFPTLALTYIPSATDTVSLEIITDNGCVVEAETIIVVISDMEPSDTTDIEDVNIYIPNVFNPTSQNPDNRNFTIQLDERIETVNYVRIFDRWGGLVYELRDHVPSPALSTWDGSRDGQIVNPGVFVYTISFTTSEGEQGVRFGDVTVVR